MKILSGHFFLFISICLGLSSWGYAGGKGSKDSSGNRGGYFQNGEELTDEVAEKKSKELADMPSYSYDSFIFDDGKYFKSSSFEINNSGSSYAYIIPKEKSTGLPYLITSIIVNLSPNQYDMFHVVLLKFISINEDRRMTMRIEIDPSQPISFGQLRKVLWPKFDLRLANGENLIQLDDSL
jgi:hypothetical protein